MSDELELLFRPASGGIQPTPVLFVHGAWHGAWCWADYFLPYFADHGYNAYALSLRGHGNSAGRERLRWASVADYVRDVAQVAALLPRPPVLVGHSMGGLIVQKYLENHDAPAAVLMASVPPAGAVRATLRIAVRHTLSFLKANMTLSLLPIVARPESARELFFSRTITGEKLQRHHSRLQDESYRAFLDMLVLDLPRPGRVKLRPLVLGAADDSIISVGEIEATAQAYGARARILPHLAHDMMLEDRWQPVADEILAWLQEQKL